MLPAKKVDLHDGQLFTFSTSLGAATVGVAQWLLRGRYELEIVGMLSGAAMAAAVLLIPTTIKLAGLRCGLLTFSVVAMLTGWFVAETGICGIAKAELTYTWVNAIGVLLSLASLSFLTQFKAASSTPKLLDTDAAPLAPQQQCELRAQSTRASALTASTLAVLLLACCALAIGFEKPALRAWLLVIVSAAAMTLAPLSVSLMLVRAKLRLQDSREPATAAEADEAGAEVDKFSVQQHLCNCGAAAMSLVALLVACSSALASIPVDPRLRVPMLAGMAIAALVLTAIAAYLLLLKQHLSMAQHQPEKDVEALQKAQKPASSGHSWMALGVFTSILGGMLLGGALLTPEALAPEALRHMGSKLPQDVQDYFLPHCIGFCLALLCHFATIRATSIECSMDAKTSCAGITVGALCAAGAICWLQASKDLSFALLHPAVAAVLALFSALLSTFCSPSSRHLRLTSAVAVLACSSVACLVASQ